MKCQQRKVRKSESKTSSQRKTPKAAVPFNTVPFNTAPFNTVPFNTAPTLPTKKVKEPHCWFDPSVRFFMYKFCDFSVFIPQRMHR
jgi:hypothetical protein